MIGKIARKFLFLVPLLLIIPDLAAQEGEEDLFLLEEAPAEEPTPVYTSEIEIGVGWSSEDSFKFGEFSGIESRGPFVIGNFFIRKRDPYDSDGTKYLTITGTNLGLDSRFLGVEYGHQGKFRIFLFLDQIPKFFLDDAQTPYILNDGGTRLTLPAGWVASDRDISELSALNGSLQPIQIDHQRTKYGGGFEVNLDRHFTLTSEFTREEKEGSRTIAVIFGTNGGNPAGAVVPEPIDYETDNFSVTLEYVNDRGQFILDYNFSTFRNNKTFLTFQNPFSSGSYDPAANFPDGFGRMALPPDNKAHQVTFSGGYLFNDKTRGTINAGYTHATQNDAFLPFTVNPGLDAPIPLPQASLVGEIDTIFANLNLNSRLTSKLTVNFNVKYEDRDNNTPRNVYIRVPNDTTDQGTIDSSQARINVPYDREQLKGEFDLKYRFSRKASLEGGYRYEELERTFSEVAKTKEHRFLAKLRFRPGSTTSGWIGFEYGDRNGTAYIDNFLFLATHTPEFLGPDPEEEFENHPLIRKFFIADRQQTRIRGAFNWLASEKVVVGMFGHYTRDDYNNTVLGLTEQKTASGTIDVSFVPSEVVSYHGYFTYESLQYDQSGLSHRPFPPLNDLTDFADQGWTANTHDKVLTVGFGMDWEAIKDKLNIKADLTLSDADTEFFLTGGNLISFMQLPELESKFYAADVRIEYQYTANILIRGRYWFQQLDVTDFALDGVNPDTMGFIIGLGNQSPNYSVHVIGISGVYRF